VKTRRGAASLGHRPLRVTRAPCARATGSASGVPLRAAPGADAPV